MEATIKIKMPEHLNEDADEILEFKRVVESYVRSMKLSFGDRIELTLQ